MNPKEILREEMKKRLKSAAPGEFRSQGNRAAALLVSSPVWVSYKTVFIFLSMKSEIDTQFLLETALLEGKKVFAPRVESDDLVFYPITSLEGPWDSGPFGIKEPAVGKPAGPDDFPALILTPGLAFDRAGRRIGRGKGYYDRFFASLDKDSRQYFALGLCMDFQQINEVPVDKNDKKVNGVLTGKPELISVK